MGLRHSDFVSLWGLSSSPRARDVEPKLVVFRLGLVVGIAPAIARLFVLAEPSELLVGPEGGFAPNELDDARAAGFTLVRFGALVLRTELAGIAALGAVVACGEAE